MKRKKYLIFLVVLAFTCLANAQLVPPTPQAKTTTPEGLPIDGGLVILALSGVLYGIKKVKK